MIPGDEGRGVRLIVNEIPYTGPLSAGQSCLGMESDPDVGPDDAAIPARFKPRRSRSCSPTSWPGAAFRIWSRARPPTSITGAPNWVMPRWPMGLRVEMAPLEDNPARLRPLTVTTAIPINRLPDIVYVDAY